MGPPHLHEDMPRPIDPQLLRFQDYYVEVETAGEFTAGMTVGYAYALLRPSAPMTAATTLQPEL